MKRIKHLVLPALILVFLGSCVSVRVASDYDKKANFNTYKTYAFYKTGIDKAEISDLDKKRILKAIDAEMTYKGFVKSANPDILVSIFTKEKRVVNIYNDLWGGSYGWGWSPYYYGRGNNITSKTEGSLYIDLIDTKNKELVWQGKGVGTLSDIHNIEKKEERIREFVSEILKAYPPNILASN